MRKKGNAPCENVDRRPEPDCCGAPDDVVGSAPAPSMEEAGRICRIALDGETPSPAELAAMLEIEPGTPQAALLDETALALARRGNGGLGYLYAQVGLDAGPCPGNCRYCDFAMCNQPATSAGADGVAGLPLDDVEHLCRLFADNGIHLVSLMSSAAYPFDLYLEAVRRARAAMGPDVAIMANTGDLSPQRARDLREAGAFCIYHAVRVGEGTITGLPEERRWQTIDNALAAGLRLATAVGPLYRPEPEGSPYRQTKRAIVERMLQVLRYDLVCGGVTKLHAVAGTKMAHVAPWPADKLRVFGGVFNLAAHGRIRHGGGGSILWADAGFDPRSRGYDGDDEALVAKIALNRRALEASGWTPAPQGAMTY